MLKAVNKILESETTMKKIYYLLVLFIVLALMPVSGLADHQLNADRVAVALIIDHSGSMKKMDPNNNRFTASRMVLELMAESDFLSITTFGDEATDLLPMTELKESGINQAKASLEQIPDFKGYTDYNAAFDQAKVNLDLVEDEGVSKFIIFLTDGEPKVRDKDADMTQYKAVLDQKMTDFASAGIPIYTVGFGDYDQEILKGISERTRGVSFQGEQNTLADNFFEVLRELKNRYAIVDENVETGSSSYEFQVDEYTSRITVLVTDESGQGQVLMQNESGENVAPVFDEGNLKVFHLNGQVKADTDLYTLSGNWQGAIRAVRDTKTKLRITEPLNNSQVAFESKIIAKVIQMGTVGASEELSAVLKKDGKYLIHPISILAFGDRYEIKLGKLPQTGNYELEVSLTNREALVARTTSSFEVKNIPTLNVDLGLNPDVWIKGQERLITASLERGGFLLTNNIKNVEIKLELMKGEESKTFTLLDDGLESSGDLVSGDGIYSVRVATPEPGDYTYSFRALGEYLNEPFQVMTEEKALTTQVPGVIVIELPNRAFIENGQAKIDIKFENQGTYMEQISAESNEQILFQGLSLEPGQSINKQVSIPVGDGEKDGRIEFGSLYQATEFKPNREKISFNEPEQAESLFTPRNLLIAGGGLLAVVGLLGLLKIRARKAHTATLQGSLLYGEEREAYTERVELTGEKPIIFTVGKVKISDRHIDSFQELGFEFEIHPIFSDRGSAVVELKCSPPGTLSQNGEITTSTILSHGDEFEMGGLFFRYELEDATEEGKNLLNGRL